MEIDGLPGTLWASDGTAWKYEDGILTGAAGPNTDLFVDPAKGEATVNAPRLLVPPEDGDFQLQAKVEVEFGSTYDAGVLLLWAGERTWAKLCFEYSPQGQPMVVTVVTRGVSDDANGFTVDGSSVWLRASRVNGAYAFHASTDGARWEFIRHFSLANARPEVGFEVQSPVGPGVTAAFGDIAYRAATLADLRDGQ